MGNSLADVVSSQLVVSVVLASFPASASFQDVRPGVDLVGVSDLR
jgi:hypothetical protein